MNIFALSYSPNLAAQALCDKHVPKMLLETAQLLCGVFETAPYKRTHYNHPCAKWVRERKENYRWLICYGLFLGEEYTFRFGKIHASTPVVRWCQDNFDTCERTFLVYQARQHTSFSGATWRTLISPFVQAMPEKYRGKDAVSAYRRYYRAEKSRFAKWERGRAAPKWLKP